MFIEFLQLKYQFVGLANVTNNAPDTAASEPAYSTVGCVLLQHLITSGHTVLIMYAHMTADGEKSNFLTKRGQLLIY